MDEIRLDPALAGQIPETCRLLQAGRLFVHPAVTAVVLSGSRGLRHTCRPDSDIDLSLLVDTGGLPVGPALARLLDAVLATSLGNWRGEVALDLAAVFDQRGCGLRCFGAQTFDTSICGGGRDCFGLYKTQHGFTGFVPPIGIQVAKFMPTLTLWRRE